MPFDTTTFEPAQRSDDPCEALDRKTYDALKTDVLAGGAGRRDFATGAAVPAHLKGTLYSARDLHASVFAEIDAQFATAFPKAAR